MFGLPKCFQKVQYLCFHAWLPVVNRQARYARIAVKTYPMVGCTRKCVHIYAKTSISLAHSYIVRGETTRHTVQFAIPPVIHAVGLFDDANAVAVSEGQIAFRLTIEVKQSSDILRLLDARESLGGYRWRRFLLLCRNAGGAN